MKNNINIIQFMPYFPPHKWWVETVWEEIGKYWVKNNFWDFINIITEFEQEGVLNVNEMIIFKWENIWYIKEWYKILVCPSLEIINNFPIYKVWDKKYWIIMQYLKEIIWENNKDFRIITHTRFFLTSLIWWLFARKNKIKWIHIEHWSEYVKLNSKIKSYISYIYDLVIWKWIFKRANAVLAISNACKIFINKKFTNRNIDIFYRWIEFTNNTVEIENLSKKFKWKKILWYVWRLYKWKNVDSLIKAYYLLDSSIKNNFQLVIIWDWEDYNRLKKIDTNNIVYFSGWKSFEEALSYQNQFDIHIHPSSPWWWLATTLLQAMNIWCMIVATPNEWAKEVISNNKNWILIENDSIEELQKGIEIAILNLKLSDKFKIQNNKNIEKYFCWNKNILTLYNLIK